MTPKEKAKELFKKYYCLKNNSKTRINVINFDTAKQCALIAVDEIINNIYKSSSFEIYYLNNDKMNEIEAISYWNEVKQEIEKL